MQNENKKRVKLLVLTLIGLLLIGLVVYLSAVFVPLGLALLVAYIFEPIFKWFGRHRVRRSLTVISVYTVLIVGLITASFRLGPVLIEQSNELFAFVEQKGLEYDITIIPFIGFIVVFVPSILIALISEHAVFSTVGVVLTFAAVEGVVEPFVGPLVIAQGVRLHPATIVVAVIAGGALFGVLGVFLAVPITAVLKILSEHYLMPVIWDVFGPSRSSKPT